MNYMLTTLYRTEFSPALVDTVSCICSKALFGDADFAVVTWSIPALNEHNVEEDRLEELTGNAQLLAGSLPGR